MQLWKHQLEAIERARTARNLALFFDAGTGKSATIINILRDDYNANRRIRRTLILTKTSVIRQFKTEFVKFSKIPEGVILTLDTDGRTRTKLVGSQPIIITNYEGMGIADFHMALMKWRPEIVILDESQSVKNHTSKRAKATYQLTDLAERKFLLSGTPIANSMLDLFGQYRAMDVSVFGKNFFAFRARYFYDRNAGMPKHLHFPDWQPLPSCAESMGKIMRDTSVQAKKSECLDLPPLVRVTKNVTMSSKQRVAYEQMRKQFVTECGNGVMSAEFAMTKTLRMQQILCGFAVPDGENPEDPRTPVWFDDVPRLDAFSELLESLGKEKVIVWTTFAPTYAKLAKIAEQQGRTVAFLTGQESSKEKADSIESFCRGPINTLIAHPRAGGVGVNLTEAAYAIYYNKGYSRIDFEQSEARNFRGGSDQHERITHYSLVAEGTLDEVINQALVDKIAISEKVLAWAKGIV